jgi:altronate hydrolase
MAQQALLVHPYDDMVVALRDLPAGSQVAFSGETVQLAEAIPAKHKFARRRLGQGELVRMYGQTVGRLVCDVEAGGLLTTRNLLHAIDPVEQVEVSRQWEAPDVTAWRGATFRGFHREDGTVGTRNFWIIIPLVFCENRNLQVLQEALLDELGYGRRSNYATFTRQLRQLYERGATEAELLAATFSKPSTHAPERYFANVDGIRFLRHEGGCGGNYQDAENLCGLFAGYINHPNVAGATVLSLGCQKSQIASLEQQLHARNPNFKKPLYIFEQQRVGTEHDLVSTALRHTFAGLVAANRSVREPAGLEHLCVGVECGGSDGFSGISANPAIGHCSDLVVANGGSVILSEFPELAGCERDLMERCVDHQLAERFLSLMRDYEQLAVMVGAGFDSNPSPGNIRDGLITDAMKSAGAAKKGGTSPVHGVLDYPEPVTQRGLNLLCTPGGDVESTTAMAGSGATLQIFSTGLGTPTGNPVSPVLKVSTNTPLAQRMPDIIDLDAGPIIEGEASIAEVGEQLFQMLVATASGDYTACAERLDQHDFIPWKRGISF